MEPNARCIFCNKLVIFMPMRGSARIQFPICPSCREKIHKIAKEIDEEKRKECD